VFDVLRDVVDDICHLIKWLIPHNQRYGTPVVCSVICTTNTWNFKVNSFKALLHASNAMFFHPLDDGITIGVFGNE